MPIFTDKERKVIKERFNNMSDKEKKDFQNRIQKAMIETTVNNDIYSTTPICNCCYCRNNRLIG